MPQAFTKDPQATLDYQVDWSNILSSVSPVDTIATSTWAIVPTGLTQDSEAETSTHARIWVSGGVVGVEYHLTNTISTAGGRSDERTIRIRIKQK